jgi:2-oxoglutarate ferredoxin oxidoreductase subunit delta
VNGDGTATATVVPAGGKAPDRLSPEAVVRYEQGDAVLTVRRAYCKGCDLCVAACPQGILALDDDERIRVTDIGRCVFCGACAARCPDFVFVLEPGARRQGR